MSKPLEMWLSTKLNRLIRCESSEMANILFDGKVYMELLASYGIPTTESSKEALSTGEAFANLKNLNYTLGLIGLHQEDEILSKIAYRDHLLSVKLLLEIYIHLERFWPFSKGSVLGEMTSFPRFRSSQDDYSRVSLNSSDASSVSRSASHVSSMPGSEAGNDSTLDDAFALYKKSTVAACRSEMNAHRMNFGKSVSLE